MSIGGAQAVACCAARRSSRSCHARRSRSGSQGIPRNRSTCPPSPDRITGDRKSTRLNSSHTVISYAVFCLKKKNKSQHNKGAEVLYAGLALHTEIRKRTTAHITHKWALLAAAQYRFIVYYARYPLHLPVGH